MEDEAPPNPEAEAKREVRRAKARARAAVYHKANAEKRAVAAVARRLAMSDEDRLARNQKTKKWRDENREKYREIAKRSKAKRRAERMKSD
jgi:hypothetical protein